MSKSYKYLSKYNETFVIESKDAGGRGGFRMQFNDRQFVLDEKLAEKLNTKIKVLKEKIENSKFYGVGFKSAK